jgi:hypothetical protein
MRTDQQKLDTEGAKKHLTPQSDSLSDFLTSGAFIQLRNY